MRKDLFEYKDYKGYLAAYIRTQPKGGRGVRLALSQHLTCPVSHISQVLNNKSHLTMEQAEAVNAFIGHTDEESQFFLLLVQLAKAGTPSLKLRLQLNLNQILERRMILKERLGVTQILSSEAQMEFYSSWIYGAIHVMLTIPEFQNKEVLSKYLGLSLRRTGEILEFLVSAGLAVKIKGNQYDIGTARIHLGADSPIISKFHTNWRMKAIQSLEKEVVSEDLHYSSAITVSKADAIKIKSLLINYIQEIKLIIKDSPAEVPMSFNIDLFKI